MSDFIPKRLHVSTDGFAPAQRLATWREVYGRGIALVDIEPIGENPFHADVTFDLLPHLSIASGSRSPAHYRVTRDLVPNCRDMIGISVLRSGRAEATQFGKDLLAGVGSGSVLVGTDPSTSTMITEGSFVTLVLSRSAIAMRVPHLSHAFGLPIAPDNPALRLLVNYIDLVRGGEPITEARLAASVSDHIIDLAALALGARSDEAELAVSRGVTEARLAALKADILGALGQFDLSSESIAARHGISPRYVRKLFERNGGSFTSFVQEERLEKARRMLTDRRSAGANVAHIAHESGFGDISHFNRTFRRRFGATPSEVREAARRQWLDQD